MSVRVSDGSGILFCASAEKDIANSTTAPTIAELLAKRQCAGTPKLKKYHF